MTSTCRHLGQQPAKRAPSPADIEADGLAEVGAVAGHCIQHGPADERRRDEPDEPAGSGEMRHMGSQAHAVSASLGFRALNPKPQTQSARQPRWTGTQACTSIWRKSTQPETGEHGGTGSDDTGTANQIASYSQDPQNAIKRTESAQSAAGTPQVAPGENQKHEAAALRKVQQCKPACRKVKSSVRCGVSISSGSRFYANVVAKLHREYVQNVQAEPRLSMSS